MVHSSRHLVLIYHCSVTLVFLGLLCLANGMEKELTVSIEPGRKECFFQNLKRGQILDLEYQVIDGGQGELDISFQLYSPSGRNIISEYKKPDYVHSYQVEEEGDHQLCWDNTFSRFNSKTVFFEFIIDHEDDSLDFQNDNIQDAEEMYESQIINMQDAMQRVKARLNKIQHLQQEQRNFEARDRNIAESNFTRVNIWSITQILVMICVGILQVITLKSLFDNSSHVHKVFRRDIVS